MFGRGPRNAIESEINGLYKSLTPIASRYRCRLSRTSAPDGRMPTVIFLGNHSSGKSTFINTLLGDPVQETGVAPTDDGFTVIVYGEEEEDFHGYAAVGCLPSDFSCLTSLGPEFLQRLCVKTRRRECLRSMNLIDSPGMIDTVGAGSGRKYDFTNAVRTLAGLSDLVLFMFDPEKPGTTGETVSVFSKCLSGIEFKLRVLLNKCDTFDNVYDFARAYGTLCWNLSKTLKTKDMPKIYTVFAPLEGLRAASKVDLTWFDRHRADILNQIKNVKDARLDSIIAAAASDFAALGIVVRMLRMFSGILFARRIFGVLLVLLTAAAAGIGFGLIVAGRCGISLFGPWCGFSWKLTWCWAAAVAVGMLAGFAGGLIVRYGNAIWRKRAAANADTYFLREFAKELATEDSGGDIRQYWLIVRNTVAGLLRSGSIPVVDFTSIKKLNRVNREKIPAIIAKRKKG